MDSQELKRAGLKATLPRLRILEILERADPRHMTAEDVYKALLDHGEDVGLATIYRVLTQFEAAGLVSRHNFESGQAVFEINRGRHHDHIVCMQCGKVEEFVDEVIEQHQRDIAGRYGFELIEHSLVLYGKCRQCASRKN
ncbi:MAG: Ferric uptake regulation protein [Gammaproteobacteria bacterium]|nr:Ferric uptake regulation protein [Gammaproteobacteria bacterium]MCG3203327.1 Ferric uptake regulation protein [Gammaproteobacteria bacterium]